MRAALARVCVWLAASFAAAAAAHIVLGLTGTAYAERAHVAIVPLALALAAIAAAGFALIVRRALDDGDARVALRIDREIASVPRSFAVAAVAGGALATLVSIETVEQVAAFGHASGIADALGGDLARGVTIVLLWAIAVVAGARRSARPLAATTAASALRASAWILTQFARRVHANDTSAWYLRAAGWPSRKQSGLRVHHAHGLRAPPRAA